MAALRTWWGELLAVIMAIAGLELIIKILPALTTAPLGMVLLREGLLIGGSIAIMLWLLRAGPVSAATMGWQRPGWRTLGYGLLCALALALVSVAMIAAMRTIGVAQNQEVLAAMGARPIWMLLLIAMTAAISEEIIFRGVALNYLTIASGSQWIGAIGSIALFALVHLSGWGWSQVAFAAVPGAVLTLFFLWKRDLGVCMIGHFLIDAIGLLGAYAQVHHQ